MLKFTKVVVRAGDGSNKERDAMLASCSKCGCTNFMVFQIFGDNHPHLQCVRCDTSYCTDEHGHKEKLDEKTSLS